MADVMKAFGTVWAWIVEAVGGDNGDDAPSVASGVRG